VIDDTDLATATPRPSDWLKLAGEYEGHGRAEFSNPKGSVEGPVRASFDESGNLDIRMAVEKFESPERTLRFGLDEFLSGEVPVPMGSGYSMGISLDFKNPCESLEVITPDGKLWAKGKILYWPRELVLTGTDRSISFKPLQPVYDVLPNKAAECWVMPLTNYLSDFCFCCDQLDNHPLRIFQTPSLPMGTFDNDSVILRLKANEKNKLTIFTFNGGLGFIEALPDYDERKGNLVTGSVRRTVTSIMVGKVS
jgi:hypothetical protein